MSSSGSQTMYTALSAMTASPNSSLEVPSISFVAAMLAVPPIQLPASAPKPFHASSDSQRCTIMYEITPPAMTPAVPISMTSTPLPMMRITDGTSTLISISTMNAGSANVLRPV